MKIIKKKIGVINLLFSILNDNNNFCIKENKILTCNKCNKDFSKLINYLSPLSSISSTELEYSDITTIFIDKKYTKSLWNYVLILQSKCYIKICAVKYDIEVMPKY